MGDLVLAESLIAGLRDREPSARVELVCRETVAGVASLYRNPPDAIIAFPFDPYLWGEPSDSVADSIRALARRIGGKIDLLIAAEFRTTPLAEALAAVTKARDVVIGAALGASDNWSVRILVEKLGVPAQTAVRRLIAVGGEHELDRYARLAESTRRLPDLRPIPTETTAKPKLIVFPFAASPIKMWPLERTVEAASRIAERFDTMIELIGSEDQREILDNLATRFPQPVSVRTGRPSNLQELAAAVSSAYGYLGVDTGLAHLAAAYGVPGVTVFGGGNWPAYAPWEPRSAGVVCPLPCFNCDWDCAFGSALCITGIDVDPVIDAFIRVRSLSSPGPISIALDSYDSHEQAIMDTAAAQYRESQADLRARLGVVLQLQTACSERDELIKRLDESLRSEQGAHVNDVESLRARLAEFESIAVSRADLIAQLETTCSDRDEIIADLQRHLAVAQETATERGALVDTLDADLRGAEKKFEERHDALMDEIAALKSACDERETIIADLQKHLAVAQETAAERGALVDKLDADLRGAEKSFEERHDTFVNEIAALKSACDEREAIIADLQKHLAEAQETAAARGALVETLDADLRGAEKNFEERHDAFVNEIAALKSACDEREAIIADLQKHLAEAQETAAARGALVETLDADLRGAQSAQKQYEERDAALAVEIAALKSACDEREAIIADLQKHLAEAQETAAARGALVETLDADLRDAQRAQKQYEERDAALAVEIAALKSACDEREAIIADLQRHLAVTQATAEERGALVETLDADLRGAQAAQQQFDERHNAILVEIATLKNVCEEREAIITDLQKHLAVTHQAAEERGALIATLDADLRSAQTARAEFEDRHNTILAEVAQLREEVAGFEREAEARRDEIAMLKNVCDERMQEIERITIEAERRSALLADTTAAFESTLRQLERQGAGRSGDASRTG